MQNKSLCLLQLYNHFINSAKTNLILKDFGVLQKLRILLYSLQ